VATFRHRKGKWQVQVRRRGCPTRSRTFTLKSDGVRWAKQTETQLDRNGVQTDPAALRRLTIGDLFRKFRDEMGPHRRGREIETIVINAFLQRKIANTLLSHRLTEAFSRYRDQRLSIVKPGTINREFSLFQHIFEIARVEWHIPVTNPIKEIRKPKADRSRERRVSRDEWERLTGASKLCRNPFLWPLVQFAVHTGMRRGELLNARWKDVDWTHATLHIPITKTDEPRTIPLTDEATLLLAGLLRDTSGDTRIFPLSAEAVKLAWKRMVVRAGITDLHFHDLRHEAVSRFFEFGLSIPEVALISGHKDPRMLFRYTHLRAEDVAKKLRQLDPKREDRTHFGQWADRTAILETSS
jgi:integrase